MGKVYYMIHYIICGEGVQHDTLRNKNYVVRVYYMIHYVICGEGVQHDTLRNMW